MTVELLYNTPLWICAKAIRKCWASEDKSDTVFEYPYGKAKIGTCGEKDKELIERVGNKNKHKSVLEHLVYTFDIDGISRACLQELARHRMASYSVKSTRYTLKELKDEKAFIVEDNPEVTDDYSFSSVAGYSLMYAYERAKKYLVFTDKEQINNNSIMALENLRDALLDGILNDKAKYCLPEAYKTSLVMTINMRSLQSMLELRLNRSALWEFNQLCIKIVQAIPKEHLYLVEDIVKEQINGNERIAELKSLFN